MKTYTKMAYLVCLIGSVILSASCTSAIRLSTQGAEDSEVTGTYRVIFYGCNFNNDLETIAFLDKEGGKYPFEPYAPDFKFRIKKGLIAKEALTEAKEFVNCNTSFRRAQTYKIIGPNGEVLGYEVRPLYEPVTYGAEDVLMTDYELKNNKVVVTIRLSPSIEMMLQGGGGKDKDK